MTAVCAAALREMCADDLVQVAAVEAAVQRFPWTAGHFADSMAAGYRCLVLEQGGELVGFSILMFVLDEMHLLNLAVAPAWQGQGLGRELLSRLLGVSRSEGAQQVFLEVRPSNARAIALYRSSGFEVVGRRAGYYPAEGGLREDAVVMRRGLDGV